jgi:hypothetical protein
MNKDLPKQLPFWEFKKYRIVMWALLGFSCLITLILEFIFHTEHPFDFLHFPFSSATLGFVACALMILAAKGLGIFLKKKDDYYDKDEHI